MESSQNFEYVYKVIMLGDCGVGKSHIMQRYVGDTFDEELDATIGAEFSEKIITLSNGVNVKVQFWDTSGDEKYSAITKSHYRGAHGALLVYDVTDYHTFLNLESWHAQLEDTLDKYAKIVVVPNKVDIPNKYPRKRKVFIEKANEYAKRKNCLFYGECSAFQNLNLRKTIEKLCEEIYTTQMECIQKGIKKPEGLKITREEKIYQERRKRCCN
ncbi:unnamed protein product [Moneuplotes crassus]|uniref:Uncharacterized protein n=1 Tax=Euplotes crassus TaxID=5936 RepID=A0AAD1XUR9_EUPCR|nr:unnamed protein product [Moneuplotes crassus]